MPSSLQTQSLFSDATEQESPVVFPLTFAEYFDVGRFSLRYHARNKNILIYVNRELYMS